MASVKFGKDSEQFKMFREIWQIYEKYYQPEENTDYWVAVMNELHEFGENRHRTKFAQKLALAVLDDLEARYKEIIKHEE